MNAEELAREEWTNCYKPASGIALNASGAQATSATSVSADQVSFKLSLSIDSVVTVLQRFAAAKKYFTALTSKLTPGDAMEEWLASPVISTSIDPITYWSGMLTAGHQLAQMALDFLSIPGINIFLSLLKYPHLILASSTDVERAFSAGGLTVSKFRHSLSDESIRASSVLGSWFSLDGAIPCNEITQVFKDKHKRPKKKQKVDESVLVQETVVDVDVDL